MLILDRIKSSPKNLPQSAQDSSDSQYCTGAVKNSQAYFVGDFCLLISAPLNPEPFDNPESFLGGYDAVDLSFFYVKDPLR